jgi:hypothetical protein
MPIEAATVLPTRAMLVGSMAAGTPKRSACVPILPVAWCVSTSLQSESSSRGVGHAHGETANGDVVRSGLDDEGRRTVGIEHGIEAVVLRGLRTETEEYATAHASDVRSRRELLEPEPFQNRCACRVS